MAPRLELVFLLGALLPTFVGAKTPWPADAKASYVSRCTGDMAAQGLPKQNAANHCSCVADSLEKEFGMEEYKIMINAQPNPRGSAADKRLHAAMSACNKYLRK